MTVYDKIQRYNQDSMRGALNYSNGKRHASGGEDYRVRWFTELGIVKFDVPFHRHLDGKDHTHFFIDIDVKLNKQLELRYSKYLEKLRLFKLAAALEYFGSWKGNFPQHEFFWKIGATGLHAIQVLNKKVDRKSFIPLITDYLFPKCEQYELVDDRLVDKSTFKAMHRCTPKCNGWYFAYESTKMGYKINKTNWKRKYRFKGINVTFNIDMNFFFDETRLARWIYSPVFKIPQRTFYSIPIQEWNIEWIANHSTLEKLESITSPFTLPTFTFGGLVNLSEVVDEKEWLGKAAKQLGKPRNGVEYDFPVRLYEVEQKKTLPYELYKTIWKMTKEFTKRGVSPCIRAHYEKAKNESGAHWSRMIIVRYLMSERGSAYNVHEVANWIRFELNTDRHNLPENRGKLVTYLKVTVGNPDAPHQVAGCKVMQDAGGKFFVCDEVMEKNCGRPHPLNSKALVIGKNTDFFLDIAVENGNKSEVKEPQALISPEADQVQNPEPQQQDEWSNIVQLTDDVINQGGDKVLWKTTRAGVTTSMIHSAKKLNKKILAVVPTNRIAAETFTNAIHMIHEKTGEIINGAILASNDRSCLKLNFLRLDLSKKKRLEEDWGDERLRWDDLIFHTKPDCISCRYYNSTIPLPIIKSDNKVYPLFRSEISSYTNRSGRCAYQTFRRSVNEFDVVFLTYAKIQSLYMTESPDGQEFLDNLINHFDILFLDEISTLAQTSPLSLPLIESGSPIINLASPMQTDFFRQLRGEVQLLQQVNQNVVVNDVIQYMQSFIGRFEGLKLRDWTEQNVSEHQNYDIIQDASADIQFRHPLEYIERENLKSHFGRYHVVLENYTKATNKILSGIEKVLLLLTHDEFIGYNLPDNSQYVKYTFVTEPNIREIRGFVQQFRSNSVSKQILVTDACLPEANISDLLQIQFDDYVIGDPRNTNMKQLIISDSRTQNVVRFLKGMKCRQNHCQFWDAYKRDCNLTLSYHYSRKKADGTKETIHVVEKALKGEDYSKRDQFLFLRDMKRFLQVFGAENIFLVLPNKRIRNWFNKNRFRMGQTKGLMVSYFRSDLTVGVECDRRIMITMGTALPPNHSYLWLAHYYHKLGLLNHYSLLELSAKLQQNSMRSAFWQTIGRAKDPAAKERSFVIAWGQGNENLLNAFNFHAVMSDSLPQFRTINTKVDASDITTAIAAYWKRYGVILNENFIKMMRYVMQPKMIGKELRMRNLKRLYHITDEDEQLLLNFCRKYNNNIRRMFHIEVKLKRWGSRMVATFCYNPKIE